jgi:PAS domain S-box-containing protein
VSGRRWALPLSGRWLAPLFLLVFSLLAISLRYVQQMKEIDRNVVALESVRLRERLSVEQNRLDAQAGVDTALLQQRLVSGLALYSGLQRAYLLDAQGRVLASLSRLDMGQPIHDLVKPPGDANGQLAALVQSPRSTSIEVARAAGLPLLTGAVPIEPDWRLLVLVDLSHTLALRLQSAKESLVREALMVLGATALLALLLHLFWFRRAERVARSLDAMGAGNLAARVDVSGGDELALIGAQANRMAEQLQSDQARIRRMSQIVDHSPMVVIEWRNAEGWPVSYASDSVAQWGYSPDDLRRGNLVYNDLVHPDDLARVNAEIEHYFAHGPDAYRQEYRIRRADGRWVWVDDRTSLRRDSMGEVAEISGILLDITAQKESEAAQREQEEHLRLFFDLPFIGMAISSPKDKRWVQVNDRLCDILGRTRAQLLKMTWAEMTHPDDLAANVKLFDELMASRSPGYQMQKRFVRPDGDEVVVDMDVRAVRNLDGSVRHLLTTIQDITARKRTETALKQSEELFRHAQRLGHMGSWTYSFADESVTWSEEVYRIFEQDPQAFQPTIDHFFAVVHPDERDRVLADARDSMKVDTPFFSAYRMCMPDGRIKHMRIRGEVERRDGRMVRSLGMIQDVTDLVQVQEALREKEALLAEAQRVAQLGNWVVNPGAGTVHWSDENFRILGFEPGAVEPSVAAFMGAVHPQDAERVKEDMQRSLSAGADARIQLEHRIVVAGEVRHVETRGRVEVNAQGEVARMFGTTMDVTDRVEAERTLQDYKEMLEQAEALVKLGSWAGDVDSQHLTVSAQLFRNVGLDPSLRVPTDEEYISRLHPQDRAMVVQDMAAIRKGQDVGELVFRTNPDHGPVRTLRRTVRRIPPDGQGQGTRYIGTLLDITEAVEAEENLKRLNLELEHRVQERTQALSIANQELEAFSYTVSHDLKAPLRGIDGYSQLLIEECMEQLDDDGRDFVQRIRYGVSQMVDLINDLLEYSRMERRDMGREPVDLLPLVHQVIELYQSDIAASQTEVRLALGPVTLPLDRDGFLVVLRNLVGNALKFSREVDRPCIEIGGRSEAGRRILWVKDNGVGFDMKYHDRIFGIFQRLHRPEEFPGTGVGLALVAKAVHRMGGRVWAESTPGAGATFFLELEE